jgi:hypothetical protein
MTNSCKRCNEKERRSIKKCFWCGADYSEDGTMVGGAAFGLLTDLSDK